MVYTSQQHELYRGRVQLRDPRMRNGDASVILRDVSLNDSGTYVCDMFIDTGPGPKSQQTHNVTLEVTENIQVSTEEPKRKPSGLAVGLSVAVFLIVTVVIVVIFLYKRYKRADGRGAVPVPSEPGSDALFKSEEPVEQT